MNRRSVLQGLARMTTGLGVGMGSMLADTAKAQPQTLRMGGADVPVMPNPEGRAFGSIPGTTFAAYDDLERQREAYQKWVALIPKILDGFDKEWIFDFPSVVREFQLWAPYPSLERYDPQRMQLFTALLPGTVGSGGARGLNSSVTLSFMHGFDRPELQWFGPPDAQITPISEWCINVRKLFHEITQRTGVQRRQGVRNPPSLSSGTSRVYFHWAVPRVSVAVPTYQKELLVWLQEGACDVGFRVRLVPTLTPESSKSGAAK
jgi:hypothetical protein